MARYPATEYSFSPGLPMEGKKVKKKDKKGTGGTSSYGSGMGYGTTPAAGPVRPRHQSGSAQPAAVAGKKRATEKAKR